METNSNGAYDVDTNKQIAVPKLIVLIKIIFLTGNLSIMAPILGSVKDASSVAREYMLANVIAEIEKDAQIFGIASDIKNVWPGAEKKTSPIEKTKNEE